MHRSRNIIRRWALSRCPTPAFGDATDGDPTLGCKNITPARLACCCRRLYTKLLSPGYRKLPETDLTFEPRRRKLNMSRLKLSCGIRDICRTSAKSMSFVDYLSKPLKSCFESRPVDIQYGANVNYFREPESSATDTKEEFSVNNHEDYYAEKHKAKKPLKTRRQSNRVMLTINNQKVCTKSSRRRFNNLLDVGQPNPLLVGNMVKQSVLEPKGQSILVNPNAQFFKLQLKQLQKTRCKQNSKSQVGELQNSKFRYSNQQILTQGLQIHKLSNPNLKNSEQKNRRRKTLELPSSENRKPLISELQSSNPRNIDLQKLNLQIRELMCVRAQGPEDSENSTENRDEENNTDPNANSEDSEFPKKENPNKFHLNNNIIKNLNSNFRWQSLRVTVKPAFSSKST